jgi:hypothetical protein
MLEAMLGGKLASRTLIDEACSRPVPFKAKSTRGRE